jgi:hypothetical protein
MKICPQCRNTYTDDDLQFCLQDGTPLTFAGSGSQIPAESLDGPETVIKSDLNQMRISLQNQTAPPTQQQNYATNSMTDFQSAPPPKSKTGLVILLGLLLLLVIGGIGGVGIWMYLNPGGTTGQNNPNTNLQNSNPSNTNVSNTNSTDNSNINLATPTATPTPKPTLKPAEIDAAKKEAESVVYGWKTAAENHNLETNLSNYADTVDYYKGGKINKSKLKASKEPAYKKYDTIDIEISNMKVSVDPTGEKATVTFDKTWDFSGIDKNGNEVFNSGSVQQQLIMNRINGKWKIVSEKDLKVYYVDKGTSEDY